MYQQCCASEYFELHAPVQVTFLAKIEHCLEPKGPICIFGENEVLVSK